MGEAHALHANLLRGQAKNADDNGPGTKEHPFKTINHAAQVLQPVERVVIAKGVYREEIRPARGGSGPDAMISYEAAPGAKVVVKGSEVVTGILGLEAWENTTSPDRGQERNVEPREIGHDGIRSLYDYRAYTVKSSGTRCGTLVQTSNSTRGFAC